MNRMQNQTPVVEAHIRGNIQEIEGMISKIINKKRNRIDCGKNYINPVEFLDVLVMPRKFKSELVNKERHPVSADKID